MFKTILVPTDGSALSDIAVHAAIEFAKFSGGKIIGLSVAESYPFTGIAEASIASDPAVFEENMQKMVQEHVQRIAVAAQQENVPCETVIGQSATPHEVIVETANKFNCDIIFMASHGRTGLSKLFLGSETQKVIAHSTIPVLVYR